MGIFLSGKKLSDKIRLVCSGKNIKCAVSYWGLGAVKDLFGAKPNFANIKVVCDIMSGCTNPTELKALDAPSNNLLRHHYGLHSKVYLSDFGAVIASANASNNGVGFNGRDEGKSIEAGTFHNVDSTAWDDARKWFLAMFEDAHKIGEIELSEAERRFVPSAPNRPEKPAQVGSLFDLVIANPNKFDRIGFVFTDVNVTAKQAISARKSVASANNGSPIVSPEIFESWPTKQMYCDWKLGDVKAWPELFFEFWRPKTRNLVLARRVFGERDVSGRNVFSQNALPQIKKHVSISLPPLDKISKTDQYAAQKLIGTERGVLFRSASALCKGLREVGYY